MARSELRPLVEFIDSVRAYFRGRCCDWFRRRNTVALRPWRARRIKGTRWSMAEDPAASIPSRAMGRTERGCVPRRRHHPQQSSPTHRSHFLHTPSPLTALLRLVPQTGYSRAPSAAGAPLNEGSVGVHAGRPAVTRVRLFHPPTPPTLAAREGSDDVGRRLGDGEGESALGASKADGCAEGFREGGGVQGG